MTRQARLLIQQQQILLAACDLGPSSQHDQHKTHFALHGWMRCTQVVIPRPSPDGPKADPSGVGLVFLEYEDTTSAEKARLALNGRMFGDKPVQASIFDQAKFDAQQFE